MDFAAFGLDWRCVSGLEIQKENSYVDLKTIPRNLKINYFRSMVGEHSAWLIVLAQLQETGNGRRDPRFHSLRRENLH